MKPKCPVFGVCGGCFYQDVPYEEELQIKEKELQALFQTKLGVARDLFDPILPSPKPYHYRNRLDLTLLKTQKGDMLFGFRQEGKKQVVETDSCAIALESISGFLPELKKRASSHLPPKYRMASVVVKGGGSEALQWGGIGRGSLKLKEEDYLWTEIDGKKIFYSLDTFFQANLSILPLVMLRLRSLPLWQPKPIFLDLYGGVGLFGLCLREQVDQVVMIEDNPHAVRLAQFNVGFHQVKGFEIWVSKVEESLEYHLHLHRNKDKVIFIDPPRSGLNPAVLEILARQAGNLLYLSCQSESLLRDLAGLKKEGWAIQKICPFDFFPKTKHIETLVWLNRVC